MRTIFLLLLLLLTPDLVSAAPSGSALDALKHLPRGQAKWVARMEAREGTPAPERWHILVYDPQVPTGVREYVVAGREVIASRTLSQFASKLTREEVIGNQPIRFNSDRAASLLQQYALANNVTVASINYGLRKDGPDAAALWHVTALDEAGNELGTVVIGAAKGTVISHAGFEVAPGRGNIKKGMFITQSAPQLSGEKRPGFFQRLGRSIAKLFGRRN
ncbi:MAG: hypothetical protein V4710_11265 [Verrucomicrobiota bacterium]